MGEEIQENLPNKRYLNWVDLTIALVGIVCLYFLLTVGTVFLMKVWPADQYVLYVNAFLTQISFAALFWALKVGRHWKWSDFGWKSVAGKKFFASVLGIYFLTWFINMSYAIFLYQQGFTPPDTDVYAKLLGQATWYTLILNLFLAGVMAPLVEETLFRGVIFGGLQTYCGKWTAAALSSAIFAALHFQAYGFFPRFMLGMFLAYLVDKYKSLYPAIALHAVNNIVAALLSASLQF